MFITKTLQNSIDNSNKIKKNLTDLLFNPRPPEPSKSLPSILSFRSASKRARSASSLRMCLSTYREGCSQVLLKNESRTPQESQIHWKPTRKYFLALYLGFQQRKLLKQGPLSQFMKTLCPHVLTAPQKKSYSGKP